MYPYPESDAFLAYLADWEANLPVAALPDPGRSAILVVDVTNGFCRSGALASRRVARIVDPIVRLFSAAWQAGLRHIALLNDTHDPQAVEFAQWPPHCVQGSAEPEPVDEIQALPFFKEMSILPKNSISSAINTGLDAWLAQRARIDTFIVAGDCTDLCTYQLAMHLRLAANAAQMTRRVIIPADCVDTYDMDVPTAQKLGILPHPGDLVHAFFLYHMALNGVEVAKQIQ